MGIQRLFGNFTTSTSGTVSASSCDGFSVAKTGSEAGRYTVTLQDGYTALYGANVSVISAQADTAYTTAKGLNSFIRNVDVVTAKTFDIQFSRTDTAADAELEDGAKVLIEIVLKNSSV